MHSPGFLFFVFIVMLLPGFTACSSATGRATSSRKEPCSTNSLSNNSHTLLEMRSTIDERGCAIIVTYLSEIVGIKVAQSYWRTGYVTWLLPSIFWGYVLQRGVVWREELVIESLFIMAWWRMAVQQLTLCQSYY